MKSRIVVLMGLALTIGILPSPAGEIHDAITAGEVDQVARMILANPDLLLEKDTNQTEDVPLHTAAISGQLEIARMLLDAQLLSINSWAMCMREFPQVEAACRHRYYVTFASSILLAAVVGTLLGYHSAVLLPATVVLGMIFVSPLFFALVLSAVPGRAERISMLLGCATIPVAHHFWPALDLLITGLIGGSLGFAIGRTLDKRGARDDAS